MAIVQASTPRLEARARHLPRASATRSRARWSSIGRLGSARHGRVLVAIEADTRTAHQYLTTLASTRSIAHQRTKLSTSSARRSAWPAPRAVQTSGEARPEPPPFQRSCPRRHHRSPPVRAPSSARLDGGEEAARPPLDVQARERRRSRREGVRRRGARLGRAAAWWRGRSPAALPRGRVLCGGDVVETPPSRPTRPATAGIPTTLGRSASDVRAACLARHGRARS